MLLSLAGWQLSCCSWGIVRWSPLHGERRLLAALLWPQHLLSDSVWLLRIIVRIVRFCFFMRCFLQACRGLPLASSFSFYCLLIVVRIVRFSFFMRCFVQACRGLPLASSFSMHWYMQSYGGLPFAGWGAIWPFCGSDVRALAVAQGV